MGNLHLKKGLFKTKAFWITTILILVIIFSGYSWIKNRPVDVTQTAKVSITGYNGSGDAGQYEVNVDNEVEKVLAKKTGFPYSKVWGLDYDNISDLPENLQDKAKNFLDQKNKVVIAFSRNKSLADNEMHTSDLNIKNGDVFYMKVKAPKSVPIKTVSKKVVISGLKKSNIITASYLKKHLQAHFYGYDGIGYVRFTSKKGFNEQSLDISKINYLHNGQKISISGNELFDSDTTVPNNSKYKGPSKISYTVNGLTDPKSIPNLDNIISKITDSEKESLGSAWNVSYKNTYISYGDQQVGSDLVNAKDYAPTSVNITNTFDKNADDYKSKGSASATLDVKKGLISNSDVTSDNVGSTRELKLSKKDNNIAFDGDTKYILIK